MARPTGVPTKITTGDVRLSRDLILSQVSPVKNRIIDCLQGGHREYDELRKLVETYIDYQTAADALGFTTSIEDRA